MSETMVSSGSNLTSDEWRDFDFSTVKVEKPRATRMLPKREAIRLVVVGALSGAAVWLMSLALQAWVMQPLFCRTPDTASICANAGVTSFVISLGVAGIVAATILVSKRVFRAIIITAATFTSLGALWPLLDGRSAALAAVIMAVFAVGLNLFFSLVLAIKRYTLAMLLATALVVAFWLLARG
ncbi:hypothetical protein FWD20_02415 [Candidatus Saccharibacteria bacterium]|nr:hypothetical protein [Candidatus Saccharibacteria bacterium]